MYVVTCSSCGKTEKSAFARVGAVTVCTGCKQPIQLRKEDIKRAFRLRTDLDDDLFKVAVVQHSAPEEIAAKSEAHIEPEAMELPDPVTDEGEHVEEHHDATALAAIAETRAETERRSDSARRRRVTPPAPPSLSGAELAQHLARARGRRTLLIVGGLGAVAAVGLIFVIAAMSGGNGTPTPPPDPSKDSKLVVVDPAKDQGKTIDPVPDPTKDKSLPDPTKDSTKVEPPKPPPVVRLKAYPMGIDRWQDVNEPYRLIQSGGPVAVLNQTTQVMPDGSRQFRAEVGSKTAGASALATVSLINDEDRVYARFERPLVLLDSGKPRLLELSIPNELARSIATLDCALQPIDTNIASPRLLDDTLAEVLTPGESAVLKLSGLNSSSYVLKETVFVLQAVDETGHVQRQWRMKYPHPVDAKTWVRFEAEVLLEDDGGMPKWRVLAAGLPTGEAVTPDPTKDKADPPTPTPVNPNERPLKDPIIRPGRGLFDF